MTKPRARTPTILVHGGCGHSKPTAQQLEVIRQSLVRGAQVLNEGGTALDGVEAAIVVMERSGRLNAGKGAKRQMDGIARMDASIMDGRDLSAGGVAAMEGILTPIRVARLVMDQTPHVLLVGKTAERLARHFTVESLPWALRRRKEAARSSRLRAEKWRQLAEELSPLGTVGAVARDAHGNVAAGTSTGGIAVMLPGRVGDSPLIGAGTYADNRSGAVSMTGEGEAIIRAGLAKEICLLMERGSSPLAAGRRALARMRKRIHGHAGAIILSATGAFSIIHTTPYMIAGYQSRKSGNMSVDLRAASLVHGRGD